jgi:hypothetical protein
MSICSRISLVVIVTLVAVGAEAQVRREPPPGGLAEYQVSRERIVKGTVVRTYQGPLNDLTILEIVADGKPLHLFLGPPAAVAKLKFSFPPGAAVEAIGMPGFKVNGGPALLTRQVKSAKQTVTLRDSTGKAVWETPLD